ncbi:uncharacterized protein KLLA0_F23485g [Kluyveromyces lactis]|uniref:KLLA0F23485p n=1 Tax=Kluyveromyces lactis (strain ATCC 8585 / CBS 2359 / DSM 70799 / NBRC 1267 / NRRL Y-1140 / WM37) TaxID=284590 RepID=Q6CIW3_KLULA|nr:uncharacterized protein KLLA0_F23485g [Kluyveromyces lactis]CAG98834.1 KLLA0F23485p [Kluyveromyces lactis]|eukprot:XP_456126.1 uncharacterized protein KLLA0_F23485g [Kluyveromyces lactis]
MNKVKSISSAISKQKVASSSYDQSYLSLLRETLDEELLRDRGSSKLLNDSTRAFLNSTWYKDSGKNGGARKDILWLPAVSSYMDVLLRERKFKQAFHMLSLLKTNKIEWIKPPGETLYKDEAGIPEELYFVFNKMMMSMTSNRLNNQELTAISKYNLHLLQKYCTKINTISPSISFLLRTLTMITKGRSLLMIKAALEIVLTSFPNMAAVQWHTVKHMTMLRFYQETDQRTKLIAYYRNHIQNTELVPLFIVQYELERFVERFLISGDETTANLGLKKYSDMGFKLRPDTITDFRAFIDRNMLKQTNKLLLELYPDSYAPLHNTLSLNDVEDSNMELVLAILNNSNVDLSQYEMNLDFLISKIPPLQQGRDYYSFFKSVVKPNFNQKMKCDIFGLFIKHASGQGFQCFIEFLESAFSDREMVLLFVANATNKARYSNFHAFFPAMSSNKPTHKTASLLLFNFLQKKIADSVELMPFDYSVLLNNSLKGHTHEEFYYYYYHFLKQHCKSFLKSDGSTYEFCFPTNISMFLSTAADKLGHSVINIQSTLIKFFEENGLNAELSHEVMRTAMVENFVPECSVERIEELEMRYLAKNGSSARNVYNIRQDKNDRVRLENLLRIIEETCTDSNNAAPVRK